MRFDRGIAAMPFVALMGLTLPVGPSVSADEVTLVVGRDATLYEDISGAFANGSGQHFFGGRTNAGAIRRGLLWFDLESAIPPGATITSVTLRVNLSLTIVGDMTMTLHRVQQEWNEGPSDPFGQEGGGGPSEIGDSTWLHTFYDDQFWNNQGGDFDASVISSADIGSPGPYTWPSTDEFVSLAQSWLDSPATNFGILVKGDETTFPSAKRFDSRENGVESSRPRLTVTFEVPPPVAELTDMAITFGQLLGGTLDDLRVSDDMRVTTRSQIGFSVLEPDIMQIQIGATTAATGTALLDITTESGLNHPIGTAVLRLRNWQTTQLQIVGSHALSGAETTVTIEDISATNRIRAADGRIELAIRHVVLAVFSALGFDSRFDLVEIAPH